MHVNILRASVHVNTIRAIHVHVNIIRASVHVNTIRASVHVNTIRARHVPQRWSQRPTLLQMACAGADIDEMSVRVA